MSVFFQKSPRGFSRVAGVEHWGRSRRAALATVMRVPDLVCPEIHFVYNSTPREFLCPISRLEAGAATQGPGRVEG